MYKASPEKAFKVSVLKGKKRKCTFLMSLAANYILSTLPSPVGLTYVTNKQTEAQVLRKT